MCDKRKIILLVEDDSIIAITETKQLENEGYRVINAASGEQAIDIVCVKNEPVDLILMDVDLGKGIDGTDAAIEILKKYDIPVIFLSSHTEKEIVQKTEKITSYGYVIKDPGMCVLDASIKMAFKLFNAKVGERKKEEALRESEEKYRTLVENSLTAAGVAKGNTFIFANKALLDIFGYESLTEFIDTPLIDTIAPESKELILERLRKRQNGEILPPRYEYRIIRKDGTLRDVEIYTSEIFINKEKCVQSVLSDITERKRTEELLRASEEKYRLLTEGITDVVWTLDPETLRFLYVSPSVEKLRGFTPEEIMATPFDAALTPEDSEYVKKLIRLHVAVFLSGKEPPDKFYINEVEQPRKDGSIVSTEVSTKYYLNKKTGKVEIQGVTRDITERKKAEMALRKSEKKYRAIIDASPIPYAINDDDENITYLNNSFIQTFGYTVEDIPTLEDWWPKAYPDEEYRRRVASTWLARVDKAKREGTAFEPMELIIHCKNGMKRNVMADAASLEDSFKGEHLVILYDITESKHTEDALRRSESFFNSIFEQSVYPMWISDKSGNMIKINKANLGLFNISPEDYIGKYNIFHDSIIEEQGYIPLIKGVYEKGRIASFDLVYDSSKLKRFNIKKFTSLILHVTIFPIIDANGTITNAIIHLIDITGRKLAEEKIQNLLQEKELILKEVHHRIKNNMNTIIGLLILQADEQENSLTKSVLHDAAGRVRSMSVLYDKLYHCENNNSVSIKEYLPSLIDEIFRMFPKMSSVEIDIQLDDIVLSAQKLSSIGIIMNELITNAMKYAFKESNKGRVTIAVSKKEKLISLIFADNGTGLPENISVDNSSGFGMQLLSMLVKQIKGAIKIERRNGTKFIIEFED